MALKLAIIGIGNIATKQYLPILSQQKEISLAYYNRTEEKSVDACKIYGGDVLSELDDIDKWSPNAVFILTSEHCRYPLCEKIIDSGIPNIFLEKPLVAAEGQSHVNEGDFYDGRALINEAEKKNINLAIMFNYRYLQQTIRVKKIVEERSFGNLVTICAKVHYACWSHCIDLIRYFCGNVDKISALKGNVSRSGQGGIQAADTSVSFCMQNGATGAILGTAEMPWQHPLFELFLTYEGGRIHMRDIDGDLEIFDSSKQVYEVIGLSRDMSRWQYMSQSFKLVISKYINSIKSCTPPPVPALEGLYELQFEAAIQRSISLKRPVEVQNEFPI